MAKSPVVLIIRDGWGVNPGGAETAERDGNSVELAETPFHDHLYETYPKGMLSASGYDVGLPDGQMGNSEVGHLNLGAGRIVYQNLTKINKAIEDDELGEKEVLKNAFEKAKQGGRLHFIGLISDGGVHSHQDHIVALTKEAKAVGVDDILLHAITDGRDTSPTGGKKFVCECEDRIAEYGAKIATVVGRYFAMDRDERWDRTKLGWDAIIHGIGEKQDVLASEAIAQKYSADKTDEFMPAMIFAHHKEQRVRDGDVILFFNFRADRARQLSDAFLGNEVGFETSPSPKVNFFTMTQYDEDYKCGVLFPPEVIENTLGKTVSEAGLTQLRIAESEKYPHVTYFFNGGEETPNAKEDRHIVNSPDVKTYDLQPEMSSDEVTNILLEKLPNYDLVILNFANPDMVGHTGSVEAAVKSVETIDAAVGKIVEKVLNLEGQILITSANSKEYQLTDGILGDVAPTLLDMLGVDQPEAMTGKTLLKKDKLCQQ